MRAARVERNRSSTGSAALAGEVIGLFASELTGWQEETARAPGATTRRPTTSA